jgi:tetratricopeptide (TPR) repeat protein
MKWPTVVWAFTQFHAQNWHPLTWISHAIDVQLYGLNPAGHHVTNLLFHLANVALLFVVLRRMTGSLWRSAFVAAVFGVHPLHVESVAWVAERKDVLSGFFFLLTLLFYGNYTNARDKSQEHRRAVMWYSLALLAFALGLMSKPMLVTVPFVLLLVDWWPLKRFEQQRRNFKDALLVLAREKIPFFVLSLASSIITVQAQTSAMATMQQLPFSYRWQNAVRSCWIYVQQTFWPSDLTIFYPHAEVSPSQLRTALIVIIGVTLIAIWLAKRAGYVTTGWFWFLGMLVPVIGLVQVGSQAHADRYMYLPHIGFFIAVTWSLAAILCNRRSSQPEQASAPGAVEPKPPHTDCHRLDHQRDGEAAVYRCTRAVWVVGPALAVVVGVLGVACNKQVGVWKDSITLFEHGARVNPKDYLARSILAQADMNAGRLNKAARELEVILSEIPRYPFSELLLATVRQQQGKMEEAIPHLLTINAPDFLAARNARLVLSYLHLGRLAEAEQVMAELLHSNGNDPAVLFMQAAVLRQGGSEQDALQLFRGLIERSGPPPLADNTTLNLETAELYVLAGEPVKAVPFYLKSIELGPENVNALNNFAWLLATCPDPQLRNGAKAVELAKRACELSRWEVPVMIGTLAAAYAEAGKFDKAVKTAEKARDLARAQEAEDLAKRNEELLEIYRNGKAYREE